MEREEKAAKKEQEAATQLEDTVNTGDQSVLQVSCIREYWDQSVLQVRCIHAASPLFQQTALLEARTHLTFGVLSAQPQPNPRWLAATSMSAGTYYTLQLVLLVTSHLIDNCPDQAFHCNM